MRNRIFIFFALMPAALMGQPVSKISVQQYIETYKELAVSEMQRVGVPASIKLAQGLLESANGNSRLAVQGNNHFGIKCKKNWTGRTIIEDDDEKGECFRAYDRAEDSYIDHSTFLTGSPRYAFLFQLDPKDYKGWAHGLKQAGYATNPRYAFIVIDLIERHRLFELDELTPERLAQLRLEREKAKEKPKDSVVIAVTPTPALPPPGMVYYYNRVPAVSVGPGQTADEIAAANGLKTKALYRYNDLEFGTPLRPNTILYIKPKRSSGSEPYHTVRAGDNMHSISQLYGIKMKQLYSKNRMEPGEIPALGEKLWLQKRNPQKPKLTDKPPAVIPDIKDSPVLPQEVKPAPPAPKDSVKTPDSTEIESALPDELEKAIEIEKVAEDRKEADRFMAETEKNKSIPEEKSQLDNIQYHEVKQGETLFSIAKKYGTSIITLQELNNLPDYAIAIGQRLIVNRNYKEPEPDVEKTDYYHEVRQGETLYSIARQYNLSVDDLKILNKLPDHTLSIGQRLLISKGEDKRSTPQVTNEEYHVVQAGETLYSISRKYNLSVETLRALNRLEGNTLGVGMRLRIR